MSPGEQQMNDVFCSLSRTWTSTSFQSTLFIFLHPFPVSSLSAFCPSFPLKDRQGASFTQRLCFLIAATQQFRRTFDFLRFDRLGLMNV